MTAHRFEQEDGTWARGLVDTKRGVNVGNVEDSYAKST
jgi:hypothetical protein